MRLTSVGAQGTSRSASGRCWKLPARCGGARDFIILDEPTARLEAREIEHLFEHIKQLKRAGVTFLFISHYLEEIYEICERVAVLRDGRLVAEAAVEGTTEAELVAAMVGETHFS